jgi:hypothetical protein
VRLNPAQLVYMAAPVLLVSATDEQVFKVLPNDSTRAMDITLVASVWTWEAGLLQTLGNTLLAEQTLACRAFLGVFYNLMADQADE